MIGIYFNDYWVWEAILRSSQQPHNGYRFDVVIIEVNGNLPANAARVVPYNRSAVWDGTTYFGASVAAVAKLGGKYGYSLVYCESRGVNCFFVHNEVLGLEEEGNTTAGLGLSPAKLHRPFRGEVLPDRGGGSWVDV